MKKRIALLLSIVLATGAFAACGKDDSSKKPETTTKPADSSNTDVATGGIKTGLAVISSIGNSKDASAEANGLAQIDSNVVAVVVGEDGKIIKCVIDSVQTKVEFDTAGKLITAKDATFKTKNELGTDYGMNKVSSIGKDWADQAAALASYVEGKTIDEVKGIALTDGKATDADLIASVTMSIGGYIEGIEKAVKNAKEVGTKADDKLGLGIVTDIAKSADAGEKDGVAQAYSTYSVVTTDADGKITASVIDASQSDVNFSKEGKITSDLAAALQTKGEKGEAYGMKGASKIGKEWNEQADAFAKYVTGKTLDEVKGIAVTDGKATDTDLTASVTVTVSTFISSIEKAVNTAK